MHAHMLLIFLLVLFSSCDMFFCLGLCPALGYNFTLTALVEFQLFVTQDPGGGLFSKPCRIVVCVLYVLHAKQIVDPERIRRLLYQVLS